MRVGVAMFPLRWRNRMYINIYVCVRVQTKHIDKDKFRRMTDKEFVVGFGRTYNM